MKNECASSPSEVEVADIRRLALYVDEDDRLCTLDREGKLIFLAIEAGKLIPTPGPDDPAEAVGSAQRSLWERY